MFVNDLIQSTIFDETQNIEKLKKVELVELLAKFLEQTQTTILYENKPVKSDLHPTMKPVALIGRLIKNSSLRDQLVYEPFGGSGSTLITADQLDRTCYCMELDPRYVDVIIERWETLINSKSVQINNS